MSGLLRTVCIFILLAVLLSAFPRYGTFSDLELGNDYNSPELYKNSEKEEDPDMQKRALMRLGKRAMMRLGKRAMMRLG